MNVTFYLYAEWKKKKLKFLECQRKPQLPNPKILQLKIGTASDSKIPFEKTENFQ